MEKKKNKTEKVNYPPIPSKDVTFATQASVPFDDVVACIYLGYNPETRSAVHAHVYRCDCSETAAMLVKQMNQLIEMPDHQKRLRKIESDLVMQGQIAPQRKNNTESLTSSGHSTRSSGSSHSDPRDPDLDRDIEKESPAPFMSVTDELKVKLADRTSAPLLLPPKDYDTICRRHGKIDDVFLNKSLNVDIVGEAGGIWGSAAEKGAVVSQENEKKNRLSSHSSSNDVQSPSSDLVSPRFKASLEDRFRNNVIISGNNVMDNRVPGPRSNSTASSPNSTLARDQYSSPRGTLERNNSHHSSPQGTLDRSDGFISPRSPNIRHSAGYQNGRHMQRLPSDEGYSSVHDKEFPNAFYYDGQSRDRVPSSPISPSSGSREMVPTSPMESRWNPNFNPAENRYDMTQSMPEKLLREYQIREDAKHSKSKSKEKKDSKKSKDKKQINHARSHSEEVVPIPQPDYDITLRVSNKTNSRPSSYNQYN